MIPRIKFSVSNWQHTSAARAEGGAHGDLRPARKATRELKVGYVGADDQENEECGAHDELVIHRRPIAVDAIEQRLDSHGQSEVGGRIRLRQSGGDHAQLFLRLPHCRTVTQAADHVVAVVAAVFKLLRRGSKRQVEVGIRGILHRLRQHADDGVDPLIELYSASQYRGIGRKPPLPESVI